MTHRDVNAAHIYIEYINKFFNPVNQPIKAINLS
jgi:hypothetical protein